MRKAVVSTAALAFLLVAGPAWACGGLVGENGTVNLLRTSTLAAYTDGVEHYVTAFSFAGAGGRFGSIVPLPGAPTKVRRAGEWTLQRLLLEVEPPVAFDALAVAEAAPAARSAKVLLETTVESLDITVLEGGALAVGNWAREHGFRLSPDAPEVLDFYARRSPIFMAVRFNAERAAKQGVEQGQSVPVHVTIPTDNPWVPLRILALGRQGLEPVEADVFLLTERKPALLAGPYRPGEDGGRSGLTLGASRPAPETLLADLRSDRGMKWVPEEMWLTYLRLDTTAGALDFDLAIDASGRGAPSPVDAGLPVGFALPRPEPWQAGVLVALVGLALALAVATLATLRRAVPA